MTHAYIEKEIFDHPLVSPGAEQRRFTRFEAWVWMILQANQNPCTKTLNKEAIQLNRGEFITSNNELSSIFDWAWGTVKTFLTKLQEDGMIHFREITGKKVVIKLLNYEKHQNILCLWNPVEREEEPEQLDVADLKGNRFDDFWAEYPKKTGKAACRSKWISKKLDLIADIIIESVRKYRETENWRKDNGQFIPNPLTFINQQRWEDEIEVSLNPTKKVMDEPTLLDRYQILQHIHDSTFEIPTKDCKKAEDSNKFFIYENARYPFQLFRGINRP